MDPAFAELLNACGVTGQRRYMSITYTATSALTNLWILNSLYKPVVTNRVWVACPVSQEFVDGFLNAYNNASGTGGSVAGQGVVERIKTVFQNAVK